MRIIRVHAHDFGKLSATLELAEGLTVVHGANESGKSTWLQAIFAGLCGRRKGRGAALEEREFERQYAPWSGARWRATVQVELDDGQRIEIDQRDLKTKKSVARDASTGRPLDSDLVHDGSIDGSTLLGLNRKVVPSTLIIGQDDIQRPQQKSDKPNDAAFALKEELQRAAASAGGAATASQALANLKDYAAKRVGTDRSNSTRPLRQAIDRLHRARKQAQEAQDRNEQPPEGDSNVAPRVAEAARKWKRAREALTLADSSPPGPPPVAAITSAADERIVHRALALLETQAPEPLAEIQERVSRLQSEHRRHQDEERETTGRGALPQWGAIAGGLAGVLAIMDLLPRFVGAAGIVLAGVCSLLFYRIQRRASAGREAPGPADRAQARQDLADARAMLRDLERRHKARERQMNSVSDALESLGLTLDKAALYHALDELATRKAGEQENAAWRLRLTEAQQKREATESELRAALAERGVEHSSTSAADLLERYEATCKRNRELTLRREIQQQIRTESGLPSGADVDEDLSAAEREVRLLRRAANVLSLAREHLAAAQDEVHRLLAPNLGEPVGRHLLKVTGGRYSEVLIDPEEGLEVRLRTEDDDLRSASELSRGTWDQVYLLLRIALAEALGDSQETAPLFLDDATVHCDAERTIRFLDLLLELSDERQIVVFSQEEEVRDWAADRLDRNPRHALVALDQSGRPTAAA